MFVPIAETISVLTMPPLIAARHAVTGYIGDSWSARSRRRAPHPHRRHDGQFRSAKVSPL
jgi:hypothetical protein